MARIGRCDSCGKEKILVKSICLDCWPKEREIDKAEEQGKKDNLAGKYAQPYQQVTNYDLFHAYERGYNWRDFV